MKIRPKLKDLSLEIRMVEIEQPKLNKFKVFILKLFGININPITFKVGDFLKRKGSDNPKELYEIKRTLFDNNFSSVLLVHDFINKTEVIVNEMSFPSFYVYNDVVPGTTVNPNDR